NTLDASGLQAHLLGNCSSNLGNPIFVAVRIRVAHFADHRDDTDRAVHRPFQLGDVPSHFGFTAFAIGDVLGYTSQSVRLLLFVKDWKSAAIDPAHRSVRPDDAVIVIHDPTDARCRDSALDARQIL